MSKPDHGHSRLGIHARVWMRAVFFGLVAYGFIHFLVFAFRWIRTIV